MEEMGRFGPWGWWRTRPVIFQPQTRTVPGKTLRDRPERVEEGRMWEARVVFSVAGICLRGASNMLFT